MYTPDMSKPSYLVYSDCSTVSPGGYPEARMRYHGVIWADDREAAMAAAIEQYGAGEYILHSAEDIAARNREVAAMPKVFGVRGKAW